MRKIYSLIILPILMISAHASASAEQCHFESGVFQCTAGYVASSCIGAGHFGVTGCYCCPEKSAPSLEQLITRSTSKILIDGVCTITQGSKITHFPIHSENTEKFVLGFAGESGARHRLEIANNSESPFAATSLVQVAVDRDNYIKNPPQLCPTQPVEEGIKCERENNALYPPYTRFAAIDNTDGTAIADASSQIYRRSLLPSEMQAGTSILLVTQKTIDNVQTRCELTVSRL